MSLTDKAPVTIAVIALILGVLATFQAFNASSQISAAKSDLSIQISDILSQLSRDEGQLSALANQIATISSRTEPKLQKITVLMGEGKVIDEDGNVIGEFHRWEPNVIVLKKGDTVELTVINQRKAAHSLVIPALGIDTGRIPGRLEEPDQSKRTVTITFTIEQAGVFQFKCGTPFNPAEGDCAPDHPYQVGYIIVLG